MVALDIGSSSVRAILYDLQMTEVLGAEFHHPQKPRIRADGTAELDADEVVRVVRRSLTEVVRLLGPRRAGKIAGVGVSTFWHGLVAADESARALTPLYLWSDSRSWSVINRLEGRLDPEQVRQRTGCPIHPSYWPAKLAWLKQERPDLWKRPVKWLSIGDLLYWRMFGRLGTSLSMASGTGLLRIADRQWDDELLSILDIRLESLPPIAAVEQGLMPGFSRLWPGLAGAPWLHAAGDGALANLGTGCLTPAQRALTVGTSGALRVMHPSPLPTLPPGLWSYRLDAGRLVTGGALSNGGNLRAWLLRALRIPDAKFEARIRNMAPAAHGLTFLPHLAGERSLGYATHAFGAMAGLTSATTPEEIARAGLEAVAIEFAQVDHRLDQVLPGAKRLVASGGAMVNSPAWVQMMADAIGRPVAMGKAKEASSYGAALFAIESLGAGDVAKLQPGVGRVFRPVRGATTAYRKAAVRQQALYQALITDRILEQPEAISRPGATRGTVAGRGRRS